MPDFTQADQPIRVDTVLEEDVLLLAGFHGREELSQPFVFDLELLSEDPNLEPGELLRTPISVGMGLPDGEVRRIHGMVRSFGFEGRRGELSFYRAEMVPWLWFLSLSRDCRIFQHLTVPQIVEKVFEDYEGAQFRTQFAQEYPEREYCVQYRETNLDFVSRLLEEEGIFYFFEHSDDGHTLVLTDYAQMQPCRGQEEARMYSESVPEQDVVRSLTQKQSVYTGTVALADYDGLKPTLELRSSMAGDEPDEFYEYQKSLFRELDEGERYARIGLEREEATHHVVRGRGTCRAFQSGYRFALTNHDRREANRDYALLEVRHMVRTGSYVAGGSQGELDYRNEFVAIPHGTPYRPPLRTRKPTMPGTQTAEVVGPAGEEVAVDEYGRVKVQFHWDREGAKDENSSCWVRVSQAWAGPKWGGMAIPHIGHEVVVDFIEGDPDRPIITGRVYNAKNMPPLALPKAKFMSIFRDDFGNQIVFDGRPGKQHLALHSPRHASTVTIGKSVNVKTNSDRNTTTIGDTTGLSFGNSASFSMGASASGTMGASLSFFAGTKVGIDLGGSFSVFAGHKIGIELSTAYSFTRSLKVESSKGPTYKYGESDHYQHTSGAIRFNSDEQVLMLGGDGNQSMLKGNKDKLLLSYGRDRHCPRSDSSRNRRMGLIASVMGMLGSLGSAAAMAGISMNVVKGKAEDIPVDETDNEGNPKWDDDEKNALAEFTDSGARSAISGALLGVGIGTSYISYVYMLSALLEIRNTADTDKVQIGKHDSAKHATITLSDTGIEAKSEDSTIEVKKAGTIEMSSGTITIAGDQKVQVNCRTFRGPNFQADQ